MADNQSSDAGEIADAGSADFECPFARVVEGVAVHFGYSVLNDPELEVSVVEELLRRLKRTASAQFATTGDAEADYAALYAQVKHQVEEENARVVASGKRQPKRSPSPGM